MSAEFGASLHTGRQPFSNPPDDARTASARSPGFGPRVLSSTSDRPVVAMLAGALLPLLLAPHAFTVPTPALARAAPARAASSMAIQLQRPGDASQSLRTTRGDTVIAPDYTMSNVCMALGAALAYAGWYAPFAHGADLGIATLALGMLCNERTGTIVPIFTNNAFQLMKKPSMTEDGIVGTLDNRFVAGGNQWEYSTITNYEFFPSLESGLPPLLVFFKETKSPWRGTGRRALEGPRTHETGQVHWMPAMYDCVQMDAEFKKHGVTKRQ